MFGSKCRLVSFKLRNINFIFQLFPQGSITCFYLHLYDTMFQALFKTTNINPFHTQQLTKEGNITILILFMRKLNYSEIK